MAGLIGPGDRKSVQPMAARDGEFGYGQLYHFVADGVWASAPLETVLLRKADHLVGHEAGCLVIDDAALPNRDSHSVRFAATQLLNVPAPAAGITIRMPAGTIASINAMQISG